MSVAGHGLNVVDLLPAIVGSGYIRGLVLACRRPAYGCLDRALVRIIIDIDRQSPYKKTKIFLRPADR